MSAKSIAISFIVAFLSNGLSSQSFVSKTTEHNTKPIAMKDETTGVDTQEKAFSVFPAANELFCDDIRPQIQNIIDRHGMEEWRYGVLTNEMHGHLGIYAIIGMKMGLRALDELSADHDHIEIISYAGIQPPISCLNDGLQVSTGATLGHGLIRISDEEIKRPEATFIHDGKNITLRLKRSSWEKISQDVRAAIEMHGALTDPYWKLIRKHAIQYWAEWDRNEIFEIVKE